MYIYTPGDSKWPFDPLVGGHLTIWKGHLTIPNRSLWITRYLHIYLVGDFPWPFSLTQKFPPLRGASAMAAWRLSGSSSAVGSTITSSCAVSCAGLALEARWPICQAGCHEKRVPLVGWVMYLEDHPRYRKWLVSPIYKPWNAHLEGEGCPT